MFHAMRFMYRKRGSDGMSEWISVDKELPPAGKEVLCLCDCGYEGVRHYGIGWRNSNGFWYAIAPFSQNPKVLAWMPLPP